MKTAFIFLRSGILVRNFVNADLVQSMVDSGHQFVIFSAEPDHPYLRKHFSHSCFVLEKMEIEIGIKALRQTRWRSFFTLVRRFTYGNTRFEENGCRQSIVAAFRNEQISHSSFLGQIFYKSILFVAATASRFKLLRRTLVTTENYSNKFSAHKRFYDRYNPVLSIVTSLGFDQDTLVMREAKAQGSQVLVLVKNWDVPTTRGIGSVVPDHVFVWNDIMGNEVIRYHDVPRNRITITGISQWDHYFRADATIPTKQKFRERFHLSSKRKTIYFAMTTPTHYKHNTTLARQLLEAIRDCAIQEPAQLLVRLHPTYVLHNGLLSEEVRDELQALSEEFGDLLSFSYPTSEEFNDFIVPGDQDDRELKEIFSYSDVLVTVYSTQMLEGTIFNIPIINAGMYNFRDTGLPIATYEAWDHIQQILDRDAINYCYSMDGVVAAINTAFEEPTNGSTARKNIADEQFIPKLRGRGGEETGRALVKLMERISL
jgi:hypothetical protein